MTMLDTKTFEFLANHPFISTIPGKPREVLIDGQNKTLPGRMVATLNSDVREWIESNTPGTKIEEGRPSMMVTLHFSEEKSAALFKLFWL